MTEPTKRQNARGCRHFNGIQHETCKAGISYRQFLYENYGNFPCLVRQDGTYSGACSAFAGWTDAEIEEQERRAAWALQQWIDALANDICPECGMKVEQKRQVGRCVYASPCGHRLYQGKLDPTMSDDEYEAQALE